MNVRKYDLLAIIALSTLLLSVPTLAQPAPWYLWKSTLNGKTTCQQTMQGAWVKVDGPFKDARCTKRA